MKDTVKTYIKDVAGAMGTIANSDTAKHAIAGGITGLILGAALGVPMLGLYVGGAGGGYHGFTKDAK